MVKEAAEAAAAAVCEEGVQLESAAAVASGAAAAAVHEEGLQLWRHAAEGEAVAKIEYV